MSVVVSVLAGYFGGYTLGVLTHEMSHYFAARLCGFRVYRVELGCGPNIANITTHRTQWKFYILPITGEVKVLFSDQTTRHKLFWFYSAGVLANVVLLAMAIWLPRHYLSLAETTYFGFAAAQALIIALTLWPWSPRNRGQYPTDGLQIAHLFTEGWEARVNVVRSGLSKFMATYADVGEPFINYQDAPAAKFDWLLNVANDRMEVVENYGRVVLDNLAFNSFTNAEKRYLLDVLLTSFLTLDFETAVPDWRQQLEKCRALILATGGNVAPTRHTASLLFLELGHDQESLELVESFDRTEMEDFLFTIVSATGARAYHRKGDTARANAWAADARARNERVQPPDALANVMRRMEMELGSNASA